MKEAQQIATDSYPFRTVRDKPPSERRGLRPREGRWLPMRQEAERAGMESQASRCSASTHLESHLLRPFQNPGLQDGGGGLRKERQQSRPSMLVAQRRTEMASILPSASHCDGHLSKHKHEEALGSALAGLPVQLWRQIHAQPCPPPRPPDRGEKG